MAVQRAAQAAYGPDVGGAVVMDPTTGDLLAVVDSGAFDPGNYVGIAGIEPFNRALEGLYPPGSAMKVVTASAALDSGTVKPTTNVTGPKEYQGVRNFESGEFGAIDFATALKFSVNTAFAQVAEDLGGRVLTRYAQAFGFNEQPNLPVEAAESSFPPPQDLSDVMWGSIGQAQVLATPMQMASVAATVANGGRRMEPRIVMGERPTGERAITGRTARTMTRLMENVVVGGTGSGARITGVRVAGKTGTAEVDVAGERKNHAWFVCFAPADDPKVAIGVVSEYGGVGGEVAAPIAGRMLVGVLPLLR
jgi:peptidoglycan glycosyltransferase